MNLKKCCLAMVALIMIFTSSVFAVETFNEEISSDSVVLTDIKSSNNLFEKNSQKVQFPGGLTKMMASIIAIEEGNLESPVTIQESVINTVVNTNNAGLISGEVLKLEELVYGMILQSANDCAVSCAASICKTQEEFIKKMNDKAKELGAVNTHFTNVTGLYNEENYTTAEDMAKIISYAVSIPKYLEIAGSKEYTLPINNKVLYERRLKSKCALISESSYIYEGITSAMTGYTEEGNYTTAVSATRNGLNVICVTMNSKDEYERYKDIKKLLDYAFNNYHTVTISRDDLNIPKAKLKKGIGTIGEVNFTLEDDVCATIPVDAEIDSLEYTYNVNKSYKKADKYTGSVLISYEGNTIAELNLKGTAVKKVTFYTVVKTILIIILILILLIIAFFVFFYIDSEKKRKKRKQQRLARSLTSQGK